MHAVVICCCCCCWRSGGAGGGGEEVIKPCRCRCCLPISALLALNMFSFHFSLLLLFCVLCGINKKTYANCSQSHSHRQTRTHTHGIRHTQTHARTHTATSNSAVRKRQHESAYEKKCLCKFPRKRDFIRKNALRSLSAPPRLAT